MNIIDEVIQVKDDDAFEMARRLAQEEGMLCGISCGAAAHAAVQVAQAAGERRQADRRRPARPRRTLPEHAAVSGVKFAGRLRLCGIRAAKPQASCVPKNLAETGCGPVSY